jgi:hypothetical protein
MKQFFYEAKDESGKALRGSVDAISAQDAVLRLQQRGLTDIRILSTDMSAVLRNDLKSLPDEVRQQHARMEIAYTRTRSGRESFWLGVLNVTRGNALMLLALAAWAGFGLGHGRMIQAATALLLMLLPYALYVWNLRHLNHYQELQRAMVFGEWARAQEMIKRLRQRSDNNDQLTMDLDVRQAQIDARQGQPLANVLAQLERWRQAMADSPGAFDSRIASVYLAAGDSGGYLDAARRGYRGTPGEPTRQVDYALAEARYGSATTAGELLDSVDLAALIPAGHKFMEWVRGVVALRQEHNDLALQHLAQAVLAFEEMARKTPTSLSSHALATAAYCVALARNGQKAEARRLLVPVQPVLRILVDPTLAAQLKAELGWRG